MAVAVMVDDFVPALTESAGTNRSVLVVDLVGHFAGWCLIDGQVVFGLGEVVTSKSKVTLSPGAI